MERDFLGRSSGNFPGARVAKVVLFAEGNSCSISSKPSLTPVSVRGRFSVNGTDFYE